MSNAAEQKTCTCSIPPTLSISWILSTALCIWFLWIHAPPVLAAKDYIRPMVYVHLVGAYSIYLACAHNTLLTPSSLGGAAQPFHVWIGRVGLILGVVGFIAGFILVWIIYDFKEDLGFSIGITFGGFAQMQCQIVGYRDIRRYKKIKTQIDACEYEDRAQLLSLEDKQDMYLTNHITCMISLFAIACGIPALIRLCEKYGNVYLLPLIFLVYCLSFSMARPLTNKIRAKRLNERNNTEESELTEGFLSFHYKSFKAMTSG